MAEEQIDHSVFAYLFFAVLFILRGMEWSGAGFVELELVLLIASGAVFFLKIYHTYYSVKQWLLAFFLMVLCCIVYLFSGKQQPVLFVLIVFCLKDTSMEKLCHTICISSLIVMILSFYLMMMGIRENVVSVVNRSLFGIGYQEYRYALGFFHANTLFVYCFVAVTSYFFVHKLTRRGFWISLGMIGLVYNITKSRTGTLLLLLFIFCLIPEVRKWMERYMFNPLVPYLMMVYISSNLFFSFMYQYDADNWLNLLDKAMQQRISLSHYYLTKYSIKLWGQPVELSNWKMSSNLQTDFKMIDNSYVLMLINYGLIFTVLIMSLYFILLRRMCQNHQYKEVLLIIIMLVYGTTEVLVPNIFINYSLILVTGLLFPNQGDSIRGRPLIEGGSRI